VTIRQDIQKLAVGQKLELFILDTTVLGGGLDYFSPNTDENRQPIVFQGHTYQPWPFMAEGFEWNGRGQSPTPTIRVANIGGAMTALALAYDDLVGAKVTRKRTLAKYLDGRAGADPTAELELDIFFVERKKQENRVFIEWELASGADLEGVFLPARQVMATCPWLYRGTECTFAGGPIADLFDVATADPDKDQCGKRLTSCKLRFGANNDLPFGGFVGAGRY
jgi:lambda family phage minor tail protein L